MRTSARTRAHPLAVPCAQRKPKAGTHAARTCGTCPSSRRCPPPLASTCWAPQARSTPWGLLQGARLPRGGRPQAAHPRPTGARPLSLDGVCMRECAHIRVCVHACVHANMRVRAPGSCVCTCVRTSVRMCAVGARMQPHTP